MSNYEDAPQYIHSRWPSDSLYVDIKLPAYQRPLTEYTVVKTQVESSLQRVPDDKQWYFAQRQECPILPSFMPDFDCLDSWYAMGGKLPWVKHTVEVCLGDEPDHSGRHMIQQIATGVELTRMPGNARLGRIGLHHVQTQVHSSDEISMTTELHMYFPDDPCNDVLREEYDSIGWAIASAEYPGQVLIPGENPCEVAYVEKFGTFCAMMGLNMSEPTFKRKGDMVTASFNSFARPRSVGASGMHTGHFSAALDLSAAHVLWPGKEVNPSMLINGNFLGPKNTIYTGTTNGGRAIYLH